MDGRGHNSLSALGAFLPLQKSAKDMDIEVNSHNSLSALGAFLRAEVRVNADEHGNPVTIAFRR